MDFKKEEGSAETEEKAITGVDDETTKESVNEFAETQQEEGKDIKVALEITPQKEENVDREAVEETKWSWRYGEIGAIVPAHLTAVPH